MTGKKSTLLVVWLLCALMLLGACGQKPADPAENAAPEVTAEPAPEPTPEPPQTAELLQVCSEENPGFCLASNAAGTRFLIAALNNNRAYDQWVQNADGSDRRDLFTLLSEEDSESLFRLHGIPQDYLIKLKKEQLEEWIGRQIEKYGSYANTLGHFIWRSPRPQNTAAAGDCILVMDSHSAVAARINLQTGETVFLDGSIIMMAADGTILSIYTAGDSAAGENASWLAPDQSVPEAAEFTLPNNIYWPTNYVLLEDRTVWMLVLGEIEKTEQDGKTVLFQSLSVVHCDSSGNILRQISAGKFPQSLAPRYLQYSEQTGIGIVYSNINIGGDLWVFGPDGDTLKPLVLESMLPPAMRTGEREEVIDESGRSTDASRPLYVFGLSEGGTKLLVQDFQSRYLLSLDLRTLQADILMTAEEIVSFAEGHSDNPGPGLEYCHWNGRDIVSCANRIRNYVIRLPFREGD